MKKLLFGLILMGSSITAYSQVGIGTPNPRGALDLNRPTTNTWGLVLPTNSNVNNILNPLGGNVIPGTLIYDSSNDCMRYYRNDGRWSNCVSDQTCEAQGSIGALNCTGAVTSGTIIENEDITATVTSSISYTGGVVGTHDGQIVSSTVVNGLTATLDPGSFDVSGNLVYTITGKPSSSGIAEFAINIGGQTCTLKVNVQQAAAFKELQCAQKIEQGGNLKSGVAYAGSDGFNTTIPYTGGNGTSYVAQTITATGVSGTLKAKLAAGTFKASGGTFVLKITGTATSTGTATFNFTIDGKDCTFTRRVANGEGKIDQLNCGSASHVGGTLYEATQYSGTSIYTNVTYSGGNGGNYSALSINSTGVGGLTAKLDAGSFTSSTGTLKFVITGTPSGSGFANFSVNIGGKTCTFTREVKEKAPPAPNLADGCSTWNLSGIIGGSSSGYVNNTNVTATLYSNSGMLANNSSDPAHTTCGVYFNTGNHSFYAKTQNSSASMTIKFNKLVSNLKVTIGIHKGEGAQVRVKRNGQLVNPVGTLSNLVGCSSSNVSFTTSGNTVSINNNSGSSGYYDDHYVFNVGGVWFDEVEIYLPKNSHSQNNGNGYLLCVGAVK